MVSVWSDTWRQNRWGVTRVLENSPSRSSMVFSSLATVLSANSARVSAWSTEKDLRHGRSFQKPLYSFMCDVWREPPREQTSFSLSVRTLISSSYLSSFREYYGHKEELLSASEHILKAHTTHIQTQTHLQTHTHTHTYTSTYTLP